MPPKPKDKNKQKQATPLKDIIPPTIKQPPREPRQIKNPEYTPIQHKINEYVPQTIPEEWPGDEIASTFDYGLDNPKAFADPVKFPLPPSIRGGPNAVVFWRRPKELIKTELGDSFSDYSIASEHRLQRKKTLQDSDLTEVARRKMAAFHKEDPDYSSPAVKKDDVKIEIF